MKNPSSFFLTDDEHRAFLRICREYPVEYDMADRLNSMGLVDMVRTDRKCSKAWCELTRTGERFRDYAARQRREILWTRGLAIAALIISLASLIVSIAR